MAEPFEKMKPRKKGKRRGRPRKPGRPSKRLKMQRARAKALQAPHAEVIPPNQGTGTRFLAKMFAHRTSSKPSALLVCDTAMDLVLLASNWFDIHADGHINISRAGSVTVNED